MRAGIGILRNLLRDIGITEYKELAKIFIEAARERQLQSKKYPQNFDDSNNSYEWAGYLMKTFAKGLAGYPTDPKIFRKQCIHSIALILGAILSVDRNPNNVIKKEEP